MIEYEYDTNKGESFDLTIEYEYDYIPEDGGYCKEIKYKVIGYRQYENDNVTLDLEIGKLTPEQTNELTAKFEQMVKDDLVLEGKLHQLCVKTTEDSMCFDDD